MALIHLLLVQSMLFAEYRRSTGLPDIIILWLWRIYLTSSIDATYLPIFTSDIKDIRQLDKYIDSRIYPQNRISSLDAYVRLWKSNPLHCLLKSRSINPKEVINALYPSSMPVKDRIHHLCTEAAHQLYRRQCALCIRYHMFRWHRRSFKSQELIVRNRSCGEPDQIMVVHYHPSEPFWPHALSTSFGGMEDGRYVVRCGREGTTPEAVQWICRYTLNRRETLRSIRDRLFEVREDYATFESWVKSMCIIADKWFYPAIMELIGGIFEKYIQDTIGAEWLNCGLRKMELFVSKDPMLARYIWETNCTSEKSRIVLAVQAGIGKKLFNGFVKSATIDDLSQYIRKRTSMQKTVYDGLSTDLKKRIRQAEADLLDAHRGVRVGLMGRYISSDAICAAESRLQELWRRADREVAALRRKSV